MSLPTDDDTPDPRESDLSRRSGNSALGGWLVVILILMAVAAAYALFHLL